ncbi:hypothetical protein PHMEG_0003494 [Phytophthora megakarya]|uniref:Uncharacterized protein n=1 Tax=Phytophthora megakarya TaxID=4795 RepID=A0A225WY01_9STRA|nr:hypothetical protein PHMEG_0003494 [Phytophthora megakarya]
MSWMVNLARSLRNYSDQYDYGATLIPHGALENLDEHAILKERMDWWGRFMYYSMMGSWDDSTRLPNETQSNWMALAHVFKSEWCRSVESKGERYYGMDMRDQETPRMFLCRLKKVAKNAGIRFEKTVSEREAHIRQFFCALSDNR